MLPQRFHSHGLRLVLFPEFLNLLFYILLFGGQLPSTVYQRLTREAINEVTDSLLEPAFGKWKILMEFNS